MGPTATVAEQARVIRLDALHRLGLAAQRHDRIESFGPIASELILEGLQSGENISVSVRVNGHAYIAGPPPGDGDADLTHNLVIEGHSRGKLEIWYRQHRFVEEELVFLNAVTEVISLWWERCIAEERVSAVLEALEEEVSRRTAELTEANEELEAFTYTVSHDLRAPLRAIQGFSSVLVEDYGDRLDDDGRRIIGVLVSSVQKLGSLIDDLLELSRIGRRNLERFDLDMDALVEDCISELCMNDPSMRDVFVVGRLGSASGDPTAVRQVWQNLIDNALKFSSRESTQKIEIGSEQTQEGTVYSVTDNGVGFDEKYAPKIFQTFERLHTSDEFEGTGIGLAIVKRIIDMHGGRVWASSTPGNGATFSFTLPGGKGIQDGER